MVASSDKLSALLPTADEMMERLALWPRRKRPMRRAGKQAEAEAEKKMLFDRLTKPSGVSDEEALRRVAKIVERAVSNGLTEVQVYRFPNSLCTDHGRAINQREPGWEKTLTGLPKEMYEFWERQLRPRGYKIGFLIVDWPGGTSGRCGDHLEMGLSSEPLCGRLRYQYFSSIQRRSLIVASSS